MIEKGTVIDGPDGQGYRVTRNVKEGDFVLPTDFEPFGGAPEPKGGEQIAGFLAYWLAITQVNK